MSLMQLTNIESDPEANVLNFPVIRNVGQATASWVIRFLGCQVRYLGYSVQIKTSVHIFDEFRWFRDNNAYQNDVTHTHTPLKMFI